MGLNNTVIMLTVGTKNLIYFTPLTLKRIVRDMFSGTILRNNKVALSFHFTRKLYRLRIFPTLFIESVTFVIRNHFCVVPSQFLERLLHNESYEDTVNNK